MSEKALVDTIRLELDSLYAQGQRIAFLCPATTARISRGHASALTSNARSSAPTSSVRRSTMRRTAAIPRSCLSGTPESLVKMAAGVMNTHSSVADARQEIFTAHAALCGAPRETLEGLMAAISVDACVELLDEVNLRQPVVAHWQGDGNPHRPAHEGAGARGIHHVYRKIRRAGRVSGRARTL